MRNIARAVGGRAGHDPILGIPNVCPTFAPLAGEPKVRGELYMKRRKRKIIVRVSLRQANLKRRLRRHLAALGFHRSQDGRLEAAGASKDAIRALHNSQRNARLKANKKFIAERLPPTELIADHCA